MFDFFEGLIEKIGVKLISDFSDKLYEWIKGIKTTQNENDKGKDYTQIGSSGDNAQIGSSGNYTKIGSSGYNAKIGSSGDNAQIGSSGDSAQIGSSGDNTQISSSGYNAKIGSSGDNTQISSSGYNAKIGSSGDNTQISSSGKYTQIGSSGDNAQIGSSGDNAQISSSGYNAKIGSSGNYTQIEINGDNSVGFACGYRSLIKAKKGTWLSLCEYEFNKDKAKYIPVYAMSVQIGNKEYKDFRGRILKEDEYYYLKDKKLYPIDLSDGIKTIKIFEKKKDGITIIKGQDFYDNKNIVYVVKSKDLSAHGETLEEALEDLKYKITKSEETEKIVKEIKETNKVTKAQYRAITGACQYGTNKFCEEHNITSEEISLDELRKILIDDYGAKTFWNLIDKGE